jgi:hypothetical protein
MQVPPFFRSKIFIALFILVSLGLIGTGILLYNVNFTRQKEEAAVIASPLLNTGVADEPITPEELIPDFKTAMMEYLPLTLSTAKATYSYKKNSILLDYCGESEQAINELKLAAEQRNVNTANFKEEDIIFQNTGDCQ